MRKLSPKARKMLKNCEGLRLKAYKCQAGKWTIGYGHIIGAHEQYLMTKAISIEEAEKLFDSDVAVREQFVDELIPPCKQNEFDAIVLLVFNIGVSNFLTSTMLKLLKENRFTEAGLQILRWVYVDDTKRKGRKIKSEGLVTRRTKEYSLYKGGIYV